MHIKDDATHLVRAELKVRDQLIKACRAMANQLRGMLKLFGLRLGQVTTPARRTERVAQRANCCEQTSFEDGDNALSRDLTPSWF